MVTLESLPVNINGRFFIIDNLRGGTQVAVGQRFRTQIELNKCRRYNRHLYCSSISEYRLNNETGTCLGSILNNDSGILDKCSVSEVSVMEDIFRKGVEGEYFYSLDKSLTFEFLCVNGLENDQILLEGLGSIKLKRECYAKHGEILLIGSDTYKIGKPYLIKPPLDLKYNFSMTLLSKSKILNITKFNNISLPEPNPILLNYNNHNQIHYYVIYSVMSVNMIIVLVAVVICCKKQVIFFEKNIHSLNTQAVNILPEQNRPIEAEPEVESIPMRDMNSINDYNLIES